MEPTRRALLAGALGAAGLAALPTPPEREVWDGRPLIEENDGECLRYFVTTTRGRRVDLTPHGNRVPEELLP